MIVDLNNVLTDIAESLDISPTDYQRAVKSYNAVGNWLEDGYSKGLYPESSRKPEIYPQGSISLGTIIQPLKKDKEGDYDVDLVCELQSEKISVSPKKLKEQVGNRLKDNDTYNNKIEEEGKRCWTLTYAESEGIGFHMDILPCIPYPEENHPDYKGAISITNKDKALNSYGWKPGNPKGFIEWFKNHYCPVKK